jgi:predicted O-methyltransferase YrrM
MAFYLQHMVSNSPFAHDYRAIRAYSMAGPARLRALYRAVEDVVTRDVAGDVVECGTARGGSAALLAMALARLDPARTLWAFDTFEGIPPATEADPDFEVARLYTGEFRGELEEVRGLFQRLSITSPVRFVKGLFQETVPTSEVGAIAVLHLDGDWYESVKICLDHLYDRVSRGGIVQIDDYGHWEGARKAVDEFLSTRQIEVTLQWIDYTGRQWVKA